MAKEMMIIFLYDLEYCKHEEDDPASAILYFHPSWVSDQQRTNLCGQIMGTVHFLKSVFSCPKVLSLQSGKFSIRAFGRYILAVGTDRNIDDWLLEYRADILNSLVSFFHNDIQIVSEQYPAYTNFKEKLYSMFETYLRILQYSGSIFSNVPLLQLPKSANNVFLEAIQILQYCQEMKTVLGGTMLYHNKVVATQLSSDVTKRLVIADPYRIKSPAELVTTKNLPLGVQLLYVYITKKEFRNLQENASRFQNLCFSSIAKNQITKKNIKPPAKEPVLSAMKRDTSLIFTTVPEEDADHCSPTTLPEIIKNVRPISERPKSLSLKFTTLDIASKIPAKPIDKPANGSVVCTPFGSKASVCSTPLAEKVLHGAVMSICNADIGFEDLFCKPEEVQASAQQNGETSGLESSQNTLETQSVNSILSGKHKADTPEETLDALDFTEFDKIVVPLIDMIIPNSIFDISRRNGSLLNIHNNQNEFYRNITLKSYGTGVGNLHKNLENNKHVYNTITDPNFPVFRSDGTVISKFLYDSCVAKHCEILETEFGQLSKMQDSINMETSITNTEDWKSVDDFDSEIKDSPVRKPVLNTGGSFDLDLPLPDGDIPSNQNKKRSLSLPLKSLSSDQCTENGFNSFSQKRNLGGVQLTPLMSKLSLLAMEEKSSGFCSRDTTPSEFRDFGLTPNEKNYSFLGRKSSSKIDQDQFGNEVEDALDQELQKAVLFICGQQDMVLGLLLEESASEKPELIKKIWEVCIETLGRLEFQLRQCLDHYPVTNSDQSETYSYLCVDPNWDTTQRGGPWGVPELGSLTQLHRDFSKARNITEITLRSEDGIVYGYRCGQTEVYYQQNSTSNQAGLPPPADSMGVVPLKARRKLERDHAIILL